MGPGFRRDCGVFRATSDPMESSPQLVMAGLDPAIHVDPRDKPGDDGFWVNELL